MFNYEYILFLLPAMILGLWAQFKVKSTFQKYSKISNSRGITGHAAARMILDRNGLQHISVQSVSGHLTDHYDPRANVIRLSDSVYNSTSAAAVGVAAHEAGHAVQKAKGYAFYKVRATIVPACSVSYNLSFILLFVGMIMDSFQLYMAGIILFSLFAFFQLVTLPVEFDASSRAMKALEAQEILSGTELAGARKTLNAAALTYVAAMITSLMQLLYFMSRTRRR